MRKECKSCDERVAKSNLRHAPVDVILSPVCATKSTTSRIVSRDLAVFPACSVRNG